MTILSGMLAIRSYYPYSESTILKLIREQDFPAVKISGGIWESDTDLIDKWRLNKIESESGLGRTGLDDRAALKRKIKDRGGAEAKDLEKKLEDIKKKAEAKAKKKAKAGKKKKAEAKKKTPKKDVSSAKDQ